MAIKDDESSVGTDATVASGDDSNADTMAAGDDSNADTMAAGDDSNADTMAAGHTEDDPGSGDAPTLAAATASLVTMDAELPTVPKDAYELGLELARGGMGRIVRARDRRINRSVALKEVLKPDALGEHRFEREALVTARLQHPGIVPVYEVGRLPSGRIFYTMRLVEGETLSKVIRRTTSYAERIALLPQVIRVCEAVAYAHAQQIIHRDIKPANILVGDYGEAVVIDWGLAKDLRAEEVEAEGTAGPYRDGSDLTMVGAVMGTPSYMPPEQARGQTVDARADVYSLGAVLYELLTGKPPYTGKSSDEVLGRVMSEPPPPIAQRDKSVPVELATIVGKAMSRRPEDRFADAKELADELQRFEAGKLVSSHSYSFGQLVRRWIRKNRAVVGAAVVALVAIAIVATVSVRGIMSARDDARAREASALLEQGRRELIAGRPERAAVFLSRAKTVDASQPLLPRLLGFAMRGIDGRVLELRDPNTKLERFAFSTDNKTLAVAGLSGRVTIYDIASGAPEAEFRAHQDTIRDLVFHPDGRLATASRDNTVAIWSPGSWKLSKRLTEHGHSVRGVWFNADGSRLVTACLDSTVRVYDTKTWALLHQIRRWLPHRALLSSDGKRVVGMGAPGVRDLATGEELLDPRLRRAARQTVSTDGDFAMLFLKDEVVAWDVKAGREIGATVGKAHGAVGKGGTELVAASGNELVLESRDGLPPGKVRMITAGTIKKPAVLTTELDDIVHMEFSATGDRFLVLHPRKLSVWTRSGDPIGVLPLASTTVSAHFSPDGRMIGARDTDGMIRVWKTPARGKGLVSSPLQISAISNNGAHLAVARLDDRLAVLGTKDASLRYELPAKHVRGAIALAIDPSGTLIAGATNDAKVRVWERDKKAPRFEIASLSFGLLFSRDGQWLVTIEGSVAAVREVRTGKRVRALNGHRGLINGAALSPRGTHLLTGSRDRTARLWDTVTGKQLLALEGHEASVVAVGFSPSGRRMVTASDDATVRVWNSEGQQLAKLQHGERITVARMIDEGRVLTASFDGNATIWDADSGEPMAQFHRDAAPITVATMVGDAEVATCSQDGVCRLWEARSGKLIHEFPKLFEGKPEALHASGDGQWLIASQQLGRAFAWSLPRESRSSDTITELVERRAPWRLAGGALIATTKRRFYSSEAIHWKRAAVHYDFSGNDADYPRRVAGVTTDEPAYATAWQAYRRGDPAGAFAALAGLVQRWKPSESRAALARELILFGARGGKSVAEIRAALGQLDPSFPTFAQGLELADHFAAVDDEAKEARALDQAATTAKQTIEVTGRRARIEMRGMRPVAAIDWLIRGVDSAAGLPDGDAARQAAFDRLRKTTNVSHKLYRKTQDPHAGAAAQKGYDKLLSLEGLPDRNKLEASRAELMRQRRKPPTIRSRGDKWTNSFSIRSRTHAIDECYRRWLDTAPVEESKRRVRIIVRLLLGQSGQVSDVATEPRAGPTGPPAIAKCVGEQVRKVRFPTVALAPTVVIRWPWIFSRKRTLPRPPTTPKPPKPTP